jgi:peptide/nickel transport system substrate-binding protein
MRGLGALALAIVVIALSACSKISTSTVQNGPAAGGTIPGTLRFAYISEPTSLNPILRKEAISTDLDLLLYGFFFNLDDKEHWVPELALAVPTYENGGISKDGLTLTYHLRHGVKWHDGEPFTSHDVVFTTHAILNQANNVQDRSGWDQLNPKDPVDAPDAYTVVFHLKKIYAPAVAVFFSEPGYPVLPAHILEKYPDINQVPFNNHPIGTGPFKFVKWKHGESVEYTANPDYWRGPPKLKRVIYKIIPTENTILTQLKTGEIDAWFRAPSNLYPEFQKLQGYRVQLEPANLFAHIDLNMKNPIFNDIRVRQAINYAIDKPRLIHDVTHDVNVPAYEDQPSFSWAYEPDVMHFDYDAQKAAQLLDDAGWKMGPDGIRVNKDGQKLAFNLSTATGSATGEAAEVLTQQMLKQVGIDASIKNYPTALFFAGYQQGGILQKGNYDVALFSWVAGVDPGDDEAIYTCYSIPPKGQNNMFWCDPRIDAAQKLALSTYDQATRKKYYSVFEKILASESVTIFSWFQRSIYVTNPHFKNFKPAPAVSSNWNSWEWEMQ